jgi:serralysin
MSGDIVRPANKLLEFAVANNFPPSVFADDATVELNQTISPNGRFRVEDVDPNSVVTRYRFRDSVTTPQSGYFTFDGVPWQQGTVLEVAAADLFRVGYRSAALVSSELISIQVFDGLFWSGIGAATYFSVTPNIDPPVISGRNMSVAIMEQIRIADFVSAIDPNGYPILNWLVNDGVNNANSGYLQLDGVNLAQQTWHNLTAAQFSRLLYVGGLTATSENVNFHARDAGAWSPFRFYSVSTLPNLNDPSVSAGTTLVRKGNKVNVDQMFSYSDLDGNSMKWVQFKDLGPSASSGYFELDGVRQDPGFFIRVNANELGRLKYVAGSVIGSENFEVQAFDGQRLSGVSRSLVTTTEIPVITPSSSTIQMLDSFASRRVADFVNIQSSISLFRVEVIDLNETISSGSLMLNGLDLEANRIHTLTAQQFADLRVRGGADDLGRSMDRYAIRLDNGFEKSAWSAFEVSTDPVNMGGVLQIGKWTYATPRLELTFNFPSTVPLYYCPNFDECGDNQPITDVGMRNAIRDALKIFETFANVKYTEVAATASADVTFMLTGAEPSAAAYAYAPGTVGDYGFGGDMWGSIDSLPSLLQSAVGQFGHFVWLHENGHSLGLKHSFDGSPILPPSMENDRFTVMSYNSVFRDSNGATVYPGTPMLYDVMAIQSLYGPNTNYNKTDTQIRIDPNSPIPRTIYDAGGVDSLNLANHVVSTTIDLRQGQFSSVGGPTDNVAIAWGTVIENARGGSGNDNIRGNEINNLLWGNAGDDTLEGRQGSDFLRGAAGNDNYVWRPGDGFDRIDEELGAGLDVWEVRLFNEHDAGLDTLKNHFLFRTLGNDLRIDLNFGSNASDGGVTIANQTFGKSRVETLRLFNADNEQIGPDINLFSISTAATSTARAFRLTENTSRYGNLAVPVV